MATLVQRSPDERFAEMIYVLCALVAYFAPLIYFVMSGSETALGLWLIISIGLLMVVS